jgi:hypothetical protein
VIQGEVKVELRYGGTFVIIGTSQRSLIDKSYDKRCSGRDG